MAGNPSREQKHNYRPIMQQNWIETLQQNWNVLIIIIIIRGII